MTGGIGGQAYNGLICQRRHRARGYVAFFQEPGWIIAGVCVCAVLLEGAVDGPTYTEERAGHLNCDMTTIGYLYLLYSGTCRTFART